MHSAKMVREELWACEFIKKKNQMGKQKREKDVGGGKKDEKQLQEN